MGGGAGVLELLLDVVPQQDVALDFVGVHDPALAVGLLVAAGDAGALADALKHVADSGLRMRLGDAGRARFESSFTLERSAAAWLALYRELTA